MKTKLKKLSKRTVSIVLSLVMLVSMAVVGMVNVSATWGYVYDGKVYFVKPSTWSNVMILIQQKDKNYSKAYALTKVKDDLYYFSPSTSVDSWLRDDSANWGIDYCFVDASGWGGEDNSMVTRRTYASHYTGTSTYQFNSSSNYYYNIYNSSSNDQAITQGYYTTRDSLKITQNANAYYKTPSASSYSSGTTGGSVQITGSYFTGDSSVSSGSSSASSSAAYDCAIGTTVTMTATPATGYDFDGWFTSANGSESAVSSTTTYSYINRSTDAQTFYARFSRTEPTYTVTATAGTGGTVSPSSGTAGETITASFTAMPKDGYSFSGWTTSDSGVTINNPSSEATTVNATAAGTITANFTEKATKTISVDVDDHVSVTVSGSSVADQDQTFTTDGSFTAHVDDVINFTAAGRTSEYTYDTLKYSNGTTDYTATSFTVESSGTYTITATSKEKSGYYFYVSAGTGAQATVKIGNGSNQTVATGTRQKFYVDDESTNATVTSAVSNSSTYENPAITLVATDIEHGSSVASPATVTKDNNGATYYVTASTKGGSDSDYYFWYATGTNQDTLSSQGKMKYINGSSGAVYFDIDVPAGNVVCSFRKDSSSWKSTYNTSAMTDPDSLTSSIERKENGQNYYNLLNFKSAGKVRFVYESTTSAYVTTASGSTDITTFDTYYLGGRFRIKDGDTGQYVFTDASEGSWQTYSVKMPFTNTSGTTYKLETNQTIAQLSAQLNGRPPYFIVHDKKTAYHTSGSSAGLNFEVQKGSDHALALTGEGSLTYENEMMFTDDENNSDGMVTIYFDSSNNNIWYAVERETAAVGTVELTAEENNETIAETTAGKTVTLKATVSNKHANAGEMTYTFYNVTTNQEIGKVTTTDSTASITYTETHVRTDDFKVVVSSGGKDSTGTGNKLRDGIAKTSVKFKNKNLYRTTTHLNGATAVLCDKENWDTANAITDGQDYTFALQLTAGQTYEFALATAYPSNNNDPSALAGNVPEDFYIDEVLTKYCDVEYYTLTVNYQNGDDTEQYVVRTYKVTPRTNCANPTVHINTNAVAVKQPNGETKYYPGSIYAVATYTPTKTETKAEEETVTYYFAEAVGDENESVSGDGMAIAYWNNSLDNIRKNNGGKDTQVAEIKNLDTYTAVSTPVNVNGSNKIYVDMSKLYEAKESTASKEFKIYSVDLPIWATSFAFVKTATKGSDVIDTTSWNEGTAYGYSSLLLNPNRVYLLYKNSTYWYSKGVVLDKGLWDSTTKNTVDTKTFKSNVINYNTSYNGDAVNNNFNTNLSSRVYNNYTNNQALYFGYFDPTSTATSTSLNDFLITNNLAMRAQTASDYHASIQNLVAEKLDTDNVNSNGFPLLEAYTDPAKHNKVNMPLFDYDMLANDKSSQSDTLIKNQYLGVDFPMYESSFNGIKTYSYDSSTDPNRAIDNNNFVIDTTWRKAAEYLGYAPFIKTDNDLYGNATELDVEFFMSNTGSLKGTDTHQHDITFNFSGDDDVWVYVDGVLVLDLGGAHMASAGSINFTDMKVYYKTAANDATSAGVVDQATWPHGSPYVNTIDLQKLLEANGVNFNNKDGNTKHTFQMFYMERGAHDSNMSVSFNLPQASGLNVTNEVTANNVNIGLKEAALYAANSDYFTYGVSAALNSGNLYTNTLAAYTAANKNPAATERILGEDDPQYPLNSATNRVYSATVAKNGSPQTLTATYPLSRLGNTPESGASYSQTTEFATLNNVTYSLSDAYLQPVDTGDTNLDVSGKTDAAGEFHLLNKQTATFDDKVTPHSFVKIYQDENLGKVNTAQTPIGYSIVSGNYTGNYYLTSYSIYDDHSSTWIKPQTSPEIVSSNDHLYVADNSENDHMFYFSDYAKQSDSAAMTVTFYNDIAVGDIRITKDYNNSSAGTTFYFDVEFANIFGSDDSNFSNYVAYNLLTYDVVDANGAIVSRGVPYGVAGVALKGGQTAIISGVPVETRYKVTERTKSGTSLEDINKYVKGPDGNNLASPIPTSHGYAEHFDSTAIKQNNISSTSTDYELKDGDKYYVNMIPIVEESYVNGSGYKTTSYVTFTNIKTSVKITFKYYDRSVQNGVPANINEANTTYTVYNSLPDTIEGETNVDVVKQKIKEMIENSAVEFQTQALTQNVVDTYIMWSSQSDAEEGIGEQTNIKTLEQYKKESNFATSKAYHTNSKSQLLNSDQTELNKWVSYKTDKGFRDESYFETGAKALEITDISVWLFNTPRTYTVNIYGAKSISELSAESTVSLNGNDTNIRVASYSLSESKITKNDVYYNQRLGQALNVDGIDTTTYISQYDRNSFRTDIEPIDYITRNTLTDNGKSYRFAYWAYDPAGQVVASRDAYFYYRITRDTDLYAVYSETQLTEQVDAGLSIYNNANDTYVDSNGKSRTRLNVVVNPYACKDSDERLKQTAMLYVNLSDVVQSWDNTDIIALFNQYREQLEEILTSNAANTVNNTGFVNFAPTVKLNGEDVSSVTLTTKGFVRNAFGNDVPNTITTTTPTAKNRVQYTMNIQTAALKKNTKLMFVGAMYYNSNYESGVNHWIISDNCLIYENGECKDLDFKLSNS